jgi:chaperonin cofactor prefoldin
MESLASQLREIIKINKQILVQLRENPSSTEDLRKAFDKRAVYTQKMEELVSVTDKEALSDEEAALLQSLFDTFGSQSEKIQQMLTKIMRESQDRLGDAVKRRKAEESYQVLK